MGRITNVERFMANFNNPSWIADAEKQDETH